MFFTLALQASCPRGRNRLSLRSRRYVNIVASLIVYMRQWFDSSYGTRFARVPAAGIEPTSAPSEGAILSIERRGVGTQSTFQRLKSQSLSTVCYDMDMIGIKTTTLLGIAVVLFIVAALLVSLSANTERQRIASITNFDECAAAGYPIMESYPERCAVPDGRTFVNERQTAPNSPTVE